MPWGSLCPPGLLHKGVQMMNQECDGSERESPALQTNLNLPGLCLFSSGRDSFEFQNPFSSPHLRYEAGIHFSSLFCNPGTMWLSFIQQNVYRSHGSFLLFYLKMLPTDWSTVALLSHLWVEWNIFEGRYIFTFSYPSPLQVLFPDLRYSEMVCYGILTHEYIGITFLLCSLLLPLWLRSFFLPANLCSCFCFQILLWWSFCFLFSFVCVFDPSVYLLHCLLIFIEGWDLILPSLLWDGMSTGPILCRSRQVI